MLGPTRCWDPNLGPLNFSAVVAPLLVGGANAQYKVPQLQLQLIPAVLPMILKPITAVPLCSLAMICPIPAVITAVTAVLKRLIFIL